MTREEIFNDMQQRIGVVPSFFKNLPLDTLGLEWELFKKRQVVPGPLANKYRELIGLGIAAVTKCKYCIFYHSEMARACGASEAEIGDALHFAKSSTGWSTYISGSQMDFEQFKEEVRQACDHVRERGLTWVPPDLMAVSFDEPTELGD